MVAYRINCNPLLRMLNNYKRMKTKTNITISLGIKSRMVRLATLLDRWSK
jgi:hypothetical protein